MSGSWESALLKATWPDDLKPDDKLVSSELRTERLRLLGLDRGGGGARSLGQHSAEVLHRLAVMAIPGNC